MHFALLKSAKDLYTQWVPKEIPEKNNLLATVTCAHSCGESASCNGTKETFWCIWCICAYGFVQDKVLKFFAVIIGTISLTNIGFGV